MYVCVLSVIERVNDSDVCGLTPSLACSVCGSSVIFLHISRPVIEMLLSQQIAGCLQEFTFDNQKISSWPITLKT